MDIEFISYDGSYPNLCGGVCKLKINGEIKTFAYSGEDYPSFWVSGGDFSLEDDYYEDVDDVAPWELSSSPKLEKDFSKDDLEKMINIFNENVPWGCCGGCI